MARRLEKWFAIIFACASLAIVAVGCGTAGRVPDGPVVTITTFNGSYEGVIALPPGRQGEGTIEVWIGGQVTSPGKYMVPTGTTILQAVQLAGGFTPYAGARDLAIIYKSGIKVRPGLHRLNRSRRLPLVWYGDPKWAKDFVLEDGMRVELPLYL